jgi:hypothetical protein
LRISVRIAEQQATHIGQPVPEECLGTISDVVKSPPLQLGISLSARQSLKFLKECKMCLKLRRILKHTFRGEPRAQFALLGIGNPI